MNRAKPVTKRVYGSRTTRTCSLLGSSPKSTASFTSSPVAASGRQDEKENKDDQLLSSSQSGYDDKPDVDAPIKLKRKRSVLESESRGTLDGFFSGAKGSHSFTANSRSTKRVKTTAPTPTTSQTQMHLAFSSKPIVRSCKDCGLSYTHGALDDEALHKRHHARAMTGVEWIRDEGGMKGVEVIAENIRLKKREAGRVLTFKGDAKGKLGLKLNLILETVNTELSAPALTDDSLSASKVFLFVLPSSTTREKVVGCVVAQHITEALPIVTKDSGDALFVDGGDTGDAGLFCDPTPLPTPLGISRLWTSAQHRGKGIATILLDAACRRGVYGCQLDPQKGQVAFSQPTNSGRAVMMKWGKGGVRIFTES